MVVAAVVVVAEVGSVWPLCFGGGGDGGDGWVVTERSGKISTMEN